ncbi:MAG: hypothetical protein JST85_26465 [Acidobacteria bacterium]|nr:hypothetical protein [Acidobacteriota bacterium]
MERTPIYTKPHIAAKLRPTLPLKNASVRLPFGSVVEANLERHALGVALEVLLNENPSRFCRSFACGSDYQSGARAAALQKAQTSVISHTWSFLFVIVRKNH